MNTFETEIIVLVELFRYSGNNQNKHHFNQLIDDFLKYSYIDAMVEKIDEDEESVVLKFIFKKINSYPELSETSLFDVKTLYKNLIETDEANYIYTYIIDLVTASNIISPGILGLKQCIFYINNQLYRTIDFNVNIRNCIQRFSSDLPSYLFENKNITLYGTYNWLREMSKHGIKSKNSFGRAIAAFNRLLLSCDSDYDIIIWLTIGLEALLCKGDTDLSKVKKIIENLKSAQIEFDKKEFHKTYDSRSRIVHGDVDFNIYPKISMLINHYDKEDKKLQKRHLVTAIDLLVKTFQHMAEKSIYELNPELTNHKKDQESLFSAINLALNKVKIGAIYYHHKDEQREKPYIIKGIALREEDEEIVVIYQAQYDGQLTWVRSLSSWLKKINDKPRFISP